MGHREHRADRRAGERTALWWREADLRQELVSQLAELRGAPRPGVSTFESDAIGGPWGRAGPLTGRSPVAAKSAAAEALAKPLVVPVPYGEDPLGGARLDALRQLFHRLIAQKFRGVVDIRTFPARFCLIGNANDGYSLAPDDLAYSRCDAVGNPEAAEFAQREPLDFANLVGELRSATHGTASVRLSTGDSTSTLVPYPEAAPGLTADAWNRAANSNNRVEVRLR